MILSTFKDNLNDTLKGASIYLAIGLAVVILVTVIIILLSGRKKK